MHFIHSLLESFLITRKESKVKDGTEDEKLRICNIYKKKNKAPPTSSSSSSHPYLNYDQSQSCKSTLQQPVRSFSKLKDKKVNHLELHSGLVKYIILNIILMDAHAARPKFCHAFFPIPFRWKEGVTATMEATSDLSGLERWI